MKDRKFWEFRAQTGGTGGKVGELYIYGSITSYKWDDSDVTAKSFKDDLEALGDIETLNVYINSPGGSVFQGQAIYSILRRFRERAAVNVFIDGLAASIASVIAMAGGTITMPRNAMMMLHNPWTIVSGNAAELRKVADDLDKIRVSIKEAYLEKAGPKLTEAKLDELLDAETWLTAQECYDYGLCDVVAPEREMAACLDEQIMSHYRHVPETLIARARPILSESDRQARIAAARQNLERIKTILEVL